MYAMVSLRTDPKAENKYLWYTYIFLLQFKKLSTDHTLKVT